MSDCFDHEADAWEEALFRPCADDVPNKHALPHCKQCRKSNLTWDMTPAGWRLFEGKKLHECDDPFKLVAALERKKK